LRLSVHGMSADDSMLEEEQTLQRGVGRGSRGRGGAGGGVEDLVGEVSCATKCLGTSQNLRVKDPIWLKLRVCRV
jgi:hypothetical protein